MSLCFDLGALALGFSLDLEHQSLFVVLGHCFGLTSFVLHFVAVACGSYSCYC